MVYCLHACLTYLHSCKKDALTINKLCISFTSLTSPGRLILSTQNHLRIQALKSPKVSVWNNCGFSRFSGSKVSASHVFFSMSKDQVWINSLIVFGMIEIVIYCDYCHGQVTSTSKRHPTSKISFTVSFPQILYIYTHKTQHSPFEWLWVSRKLFSI